jgi:peroxiredoxin
MQAPPTRREAENTNKESPMPRVSLDRIAPDFSLADYHGKTVSLSDYRGKKNVLLVFNRTFN